MASPKLNLRSLLKEKVLFHQPMPDKQRDILRAAEDLFSQSGYAGTTTAEIARTAQVTERTLFKYFPSKQELFRRILFPIVVRVVFPAQMKQTKAILGQEHPDFETFVRRLLNDRVHAGLEHGEKLKILFGEFLQNDEFRNEFSRIWCEQVWGDLVKALRGMQKRKLIRSGIEPELMARWLLILAAGNVFFWTVLSNDPDRIEKEFDSTVRFIVGAFT
jgi:TetR/AcrR family transcriptional regulator